ncbi:DUF4261 domain-containing protein [Rubritalea spongiae]|uniref:DUF4261 domain-containing protein n=1 Tax=Rubritalea spongiae TaxID=430797 RepID=A0ABW5E2D0_9BACT
MIRVKQLALLLALPFIHQPLAAEPNKEPEIPTTGLKPLRPATEAQFAFLCLNNVKIAKSEDLKQALVKWFKLSSEKEIHEWKFKPETQTFSWRIGRSRFVASFEAQPIPKDDIRYASNNSIHWPNAEQEMLKHAAHYTITCTSIHHEPWHAALDLSHAIAALTETHQPTGIYWGDASIVHAPNSFLKQANYQLDQAGKVPSSLWIGILFESNTKGGWNIFTDGFSPLGHKDIEIHNSQLQRTLLFDLLNDLKQRVLERKLKLTNDLIIDGPDNTQWKINTGKSIIGKTKPVWILTQQ